MKLEEIKELIKILEESRLQKMAVKKGDFEIVLEKEEVSRPMPRVVKQETVSTPVETMEEDGVFITSPIVGTFYRSPQPDLPPFVKLGDSVDENSIVCVVEAMKVMNEVKAGKKGVVSEILVDNSQPVEFGTKLFRVT